jgi:multidrug/hemolysin transport system permease protein
VIALVRRDLCLFFRSWTRLAFALQGLFVVVGVSAMGALAMGGEDAFTVAWSLSGLLAATAVTSTASALSVMADDEERDAASDFLATPAQRMTLVAGYFSAALFAGLLIGLSGLAIGIVLLAFLGEGSIELGAFVEGAGIVALSVFSSGSLAALAASIASNSRQYRAASAVLAIIALAAYAPASGTLASAFARFLPVSHSAALFRGLLVTKLPATLPGLVAGPGSVVMSLIFLAITGLFCYGMALGNIMRRLGD